MDYKKIINEQIEELQKRQKKLEGKTVAIDDYLKIAKTISELAVMANQM